MMKTSGFARYFTPEPIAKMMVQIVVGDNNDAKNINETACGSGRMNLATHSVNHRLFHLANDLDLTCAKMTALNFLIHGVKRIVTCDNGLFPGHNDFKCIFVTNYQTAPFVKYINDKDSAYLFINNNMPKRANQSDYVAQNFPKQHKFKHEFGVVTQLTLF